MMQITSTHTAIVGTLSHGLTSLQERLRNLYAQQEEEIAQ